MSENDFNKQGLNCIKFMIESLMKNEIDKDHAISDEIINDLASLHSNIQEFENEI